MLLPRKGGFLLQPFSCLRHRNSCAGNDKGWGAGVNSVDKIHQALLLAGVVVVVFFFFLQVTLVALVISQSVRFFFFWLQREHKR